MNVLKLIATGFLVVFNSTLLAADHSMHGGSGEKNDGSGCKAAKIAKFNPAPLTEVAPGTDFSFLVFDAPSLKQIEVSVKKIAVPVTMEDKEAFVLVRGKLPDSLKATPARISVKIKGKTAKCNTEEGWLLKITG